MTRRGRTRRRPRSRAATAHIPAAATDAATTTARSTIATTAADATTTTAAAATVRAANRWRRIWVLAAEVLVEVAPVGEGQFAYGALEGALLLVHRANMLPKQKIGRGEGGGEAHQTKERPYQTRRAHQWTHPCTPMVSTSTPHPSRDSHEDHDHPTLPSPPPSETYLLEVVALPKRAPTLVALKRPRALVDGEDVLLAAALVLKLRTALGAAVGARANVHFCRVAVAVLLEKEPRVALPTRILPRPAACGRWVRVTGRARLDLVVVLAAAADGGGRAAGAARGSHAGGGGGGSGGTTARCGGGGAASQRWGDCHRVQPRRCAAAAGQLRLARRQTAIPAPAAQAVDRQQAMWATRARCRRRRCSRRGRVTARLQRWRQGRPATLAGGLGGHAHPFHPSQRQHRR